MTCPCKHLDHEEGKYEDCTLETAAPHFPDVKFWRRGPRWTDAPEGWPRGATNVQFCKLRGRINGIFQCYNPGELHCYEPAEASGEEPTP